MVGKGIDIWDKLGLVGVCCSVVDVVCKWDDQIVMFVLIGVDFQYFGFGDVVKFGLVKVVVGMVDFVGQCGYQCYFVGFVMGQVVDGVGQCWIIYMQCGRCDDQFGQFFGILK